MKDEIIEKILIKKLQNKKIATKKIGIKFDRNKNKGERNLKKNKKWSPNKINNN